MTDLDVVTWPNGVVVDAATVLREVDAVRAVCAIAWIDDSTILTPDQVAAELVQASQAAARHLVVTTVAARLKRATSRALQDKRDDLTARGVSPLEVRRQTRDEKRAYDEAAEAAEAARRAGNLLSDHTSRLQSIGNRVDVTYRVGGA
ncbi:hypothetical protein [Microbacterium sp.]|uniref:hypothetical protein n=1 Tax=Microbacterium sp. TaxID=51671 RepID=UPI0039E3726B